MARIEFAYKGMKIVIDEKHPDAVVTVDGREFRCHHHHPKDGKGLSAWVCREAYFASHDIKELARHFADYGYMFDDPARVVVDDAGAVVAPGKPGKGGAQSKKPKGGDHGEHGSGKGGH